MSVSILKAVLCVSAHQEKYWLLITGHVKVLYSMFNALVINIHHLQILMSAQKIMEIVRTSVSTPMVVLHVNASKGEL